MQEPKKTTNGVSIQSCKRLGCKSISGTFSVSSQSKWYLETVGFDLPLPLVYWPEVGKAWILQFFCKELFSKYLALLQVPSFLCKKNLK